MHNNEELRRKIEVSGELMRAQTLLDEITSYKSTGDSGYDDTTLDLLLRIYLADSRNIRAKDICEQLMLSPSHISRTLEEIESNGLVVREKDPNDGRAQVIRLSDKGVCAVEDFIPRLTVALDMTIYASLNDQEIASFTAILKKLNSHMENTVEELFCDK